MTCTTLVTVFYLLIVVLVMRTHYQISLLVLHMLCVWGANFEVCSILVLISILIDFYALVEYFLVAAIVLIGWGVFYD